jgi:hypothetical protein
VFLGAFFTKSQPLAWAKLASPQIGRDGLLIGAGVTIVVPVSGAAAQHYALGRLNLRDLCVCADTFAFGGQRFCTDSKKRGVGIPHRPFIVVSEW